MGEDYCVSYEGGVSCTEVRARAVLVTRDGFAISSLRSSLGLTFKNSGVDIADTMLSRYITTLAARRGGGTRAKWVLRQSDCMMRCCRFAPLPSSPTSPIVAPEHTITLCPISWSLASPKQSLTHPPFQPSFPISICSTPLNV